MTAVSCTSVSHGYLAKSRFFDNTGPAAEGVERIFMLGQYSAAIAKNAHILKNNQEAAAQSEKISNGFGAARSALGVSRLGFPVEKFFTGKMFWQRYTADDIAEAKANGSGLPFMVEGAWKKVAVDAQGNLQKVDGQFTYVGEDKPGKYLTRDWMDIAMDLLVLAARLLSPLTWLHGLKAIDLGKHAKGVGTAISALWGVIITLNLIQNTRDLINETDLREIRKKVANLLIGAIDWIIIPFDVFEIGMNGSPVLALVGAGLCLVSAAGYLAKEALFYS